MAGSSLVLIPVLKSAVLPVLVSGGIAVALSKLVRSEQRTDWIPALALLVGWGLSFFAVSGFTGFPPRSVINWLPYLALALLPLLVLTASRSFAARLVLMTGVLAAVLYVLLRPRFQAWTGSEAMFWCLALLEQWLLAWVLWARCVRADGDRPSGDRWIWMVMAATAISLVCVFGSAKLAQLFGALGAASGGLFLASRLNPRLQPGPVTIGLFVMLFGGFCVQALIYGQIAQAAVLLAFCTILTPALSLLPFYRARGLLVRISVAVLVNALPIALALTWLARLAAQVEDYDY